jgi:hypothetical protein
MGQARWVNPPCVHVKVLWVSSVGRLEVRDSHSLIPSLRRCPKCTCRSSAVKYRSTSLCGQSS